MQPDQLICFPCVRDFLALDNDLDRFDYAADLALASPSLAPEECTEENRIIACDSGLYYRLSRKTDYLTLTVQSGSLLVKGYADILGCILKDTSLSQLVQEPIGFAAFLAQRGLLTPERKDGLTELEFHILAFAKNIKKCKV